MVNELDQAVRRGRVDGVGSISHKASLEPCVGGWKGTLCVSVVDNAGEHCASITLRTTEPFESKTAAEYSLYSTAVSVMQESSHYKSPGGPSEDEHLGYSIALIEAASDSLARAGGYEEQRTLLNVVSRQLSTSASSYRPRKNQKPSSAANINSLCNLVASMTVGLAPNSRSQKVNVCDEP